jgi:hypothetical protein
MPVQFQFFISHGEAYLTGDRSAALCLFAVQTFFDAVFSFLGIRTKRPAGRAAPPEGSGRNFPAQDSRAPPVQALAALVAAVL